MFASIIYLAQHYFLDWSDQNANGVTPLHIAVAAENVALVATLVKCGADVAVRDRNGLSAIMAAVQSNADPILCCLVRSETLGDEVVREICNAYKLDSKTTVDDLRQHVVAKAVQCIEEIMQHVVLANANLHSVAMGRLDGVRAEINQKKMVVILDNSPILIHGELDSDRADFPVRARVRLIRMLEQQADETIAAKVGQEILELEQEDELADKVDLLRRQVIAEADNTIYLAQICLPPKSYAEFRASAGKQLQNTLMKAGIRWSLPPAK